MSDITDAISSLYPGACWQITNEDYETLEWNSKDIPKPTQHELDTELARLQAEYDAKEYQRLREPAYPSIKDQLDTLFHGGLEEWRSQIQAVKDQFPKP